MFVMVQTRVRNLWFSPNWPWNSLSFSKIKTNKALLKEGIARTVSEVPHRCMLFWGLQPWRLASPAFQWATSLAESAPPESCLGFQSNVNTYDGFEHTQKQTVEKNIQNSIERIHVFERVLGLQQRGLQNPNRLENFWASDTQRLCVVSKTTCGQLDVSTAPPITLHDLSRHKEWSTWQIASAMGCPHSLFCLWIAHIIT